MKTYGMYGTPEYHAWYNMLRRCYNKKDPRYKDYGGRGITVCRRWRRSFKNFYKDMGPRPKGKTLDRKNNNGNYTPNNCRWATPRQQNNNARFNRRVIYKGRERTLAQAIRKSGLGISTVYYRLGRGLSIEEALKAI